MWAMMILFNFPFTERRQGSKATAVCSCFPQSLLLLSIYETEGNPKFLANENGANDAKVCLEV